MTGRRGRRREELLDILKERRGYCKLKEEALDRTVWRTRLGRFYGTVVRHYGMDEYADIHIQGVCFTEWGQFT